MTKDQVDELWACVRRIDTAHMGICMNNYQADQGLKPHLDTIAGALTEARPLLAALRKAAPFVEVGEYSGGGYNVQTHVNEGVLRANPEGVARMVGAEVKTAILGRFRMQEGLAAKSKPDPGGQVAAGQGCRHRDAELPEGAMSELKATPCVMVSIGNSTDGLIGRLRAWGAEAEAYPIHTMLLSAFAYAAIYEPEDAERLLAWLAEQGVTPS